MQCRGPRLRGIALGPASSMPWLLVPLFALQITVSSAQATVQATHAVPAPAAASQAVPHAPVGTAKRIVPFYISFAALQALDVHSTLRAIDRGATEGNVFMQPFASRPAAFIAMKAGVTAGLILADAHLSRNHRVAALALMVAANGAYAAIVAHNYRVAASRQ